MVNFSFPKVEFQSFLRRGSRHNGIALAAVAGLVAYVARNRRVDEARPVVREARRDGARAFRTHQGGGRTGAEIALAGGVVGSRAHRRDVAVVRLVALLERRARILVGEALRLGIGEG